ncbi:UNVERIFIED_CONTAM: hypothetical protein GTU68_001344 [Idotea baltica]|nr:hypothetical protein [Idotea baltica]
MSAALPVNLRQGDDLKPKTQKTWCLSNYGRSADIDGLSRAPLQLAIVKRLVKEKVLSATDFKEYSPGWRQAIDALDKKGWLESRESEPSLKSTLVTSDSAKYHALDSDLLNIEQKNAIEDLQETIKADTFSCTLLHGVTGSGKTEVYFEAIASVISSGRQVLILVPEIGLTPQLINRINSYFEVPVSIMHSGLNKTERHLAWWHARSGNAKIILGTRSAVFSSCADLGLIVVDEEHDASFKQQDGVRYHARDVAIYRAKQHDIPILLGSATPSLETYANAKSGRYHLLELTQRATHVALPEIALLDLNTTTTEDGLSLPMFEAIRDCLSIGKQSILFLNRRGYAPVLFCTDCKQSVSCHRCDSNLTLHRRANRVRCHHCGYEGVVPKQCHHCQGQTMAEIGEGTQRVEEALEQRFPNAKILRIDRDSTSRKGELDRLLQQARDGDADILLGTQLLTKGHDFPEVALVGVLNADQGLYSTDFRATENLFQQILQVAGRAGRREQVGRVLIQTAFPEHRFFERICQHDFNGFAQELLTERQVANFPPFGFFALLHAESTHQAKALQFLRRAKKDINPVDGVNVMDVIPAPMERRAGRFRAQLLLTSNQRSTLNASLSQWLMLLESDKEVRKLASSVRWHLDIDPQNLF